MTKEKFVLSISIIIKNFYFNFMMSNNFIRKWVIDNDNIEIITLIKFIFHCAQFIKNFSLLTHNYIKRHSNDEENAWTLIFVQYLYKQLHEEMCDDVDYTWSKSS